MIMRALPLGMFLLVACGSEVVGAGGGVGGEGVGGATCQAFADEASPGSVTFRFINQTPIDVFLPASCGLVDFQIQPAAGPDGDYYGWVGGPCSLTCEDLQSQGQIYCDAGACAPSSFRVPAGGSLDVSWDQLAQHSTEMPAACWAEPNSGTSCQQIVGAAAGSYTLAITGYDGCASDPAACQCDASGLCDGDATGLTTFNGPVGFSLPSAGVVEFVFDPCAFGCAGEPAGP